MFCIYNKILHSVFSKIFKTNNSNTIASCQFYSGNLNFSLLYHFHRYMFLSKMLLQKKLDETSKIDSLDFKEFISLQSKYKFLKTDSKISLKKKLFKEFEKSISM